jgi:hypothetical protein
LVKSLALPSLALFALAATACTKSSPETTAGGTASSAAPSAPPAASEPASLPRDAPPDLDVDGLQKKLACAGDTRRQACRILREFADAGRFTPQIPSGEGRWIGYAHTLEKGVEKSELMILAASQIPTSKVPSGELALHFAIGPIPEDKREHGTKLANALSRGDTVPRSNQAVSYVKAWTPAVGEGSMSTAGTSIRLVTEETFLRQVGTTKVLLVRVKPASAEGALPVATLAELWPASW